MACPDLQYMDGETLTNNRSTRKYKGKHSKKGAGRPITYSKEIEDDLITWVLKQRDLQIPVSRQDIRHKANALIKPSNPQFKASSTLDG